MRGERGLLTFFTAVIGNVVLDYRELWVSDDCKIDRMPDAMEGAAQAQSVGGLMNRTATLVSALIFALIPLACGNSDGDSGADGSGKISGEGSHRTPDGKAASAEFASGDCPIESSTVEEALGIRSVRRISSFDGAILAPIPTHSAGAFDGPPIVYRYVCVFESPSAAVAVASSPPVPPVKRDELDDPTFAGVRRQLQNPAADIEEIRRGWEHAASKTHLREIQVTDRPEWGDGAFLVRIEEDGGAIDKWLYATMPGGAINIVVNSAAARGAEPAVTEPVEGALDALVAEVSPAN